MKHLTFCLFSWVAGWRVLAKAIVFSWWLSCALGCWTTTATATTRIWLGNNSALWSAPDNWTPFGTPQNGDSLTFASPGFSGSSINNDIPNLVIDTILFTQGGYSLNGNALTLNQGITDNHSGALNRVRFDLQFTSGGGRFNTLTSGQLEVTGTTTLANNQDLIITALETNITVSGVIQGNGGLIKRSPGTLFLRGTGANTYTGATRLEGGAMHLAKPSAARAISPIVVIDDANSLSDDLPGQYPPVFSMTMTNGGTWFITNGATVTNLTLTSWGSIDGSGLLTLQCDVNVFPSAEAGFFVSYSDIFCTLYLGDQTRTFTVTDNANGIVDFYIDGQIIGPGPGPGSAGIVKKGSGQMVLSAANIYFGPTLIQGGELAITADGALGGTGAGAETIVDEGILTFLGPLSVAEPLIMTGGDIDFAGSITLSGPVVISNYCTVTGRSDISLLEIAGVISGPRVFELNGGILRLTGSAPNTFGSAVNSFLSVVPYNPLFGVSRATLELAKPDDVMAVPVPVTLYAAVDTNQAVLRNLQNGGVSDVTIYHGGSWQLNGHTAAPAALTFTGDGYVDTQGGLLQLTNPNTNQLRVLTGFPANYIAGISGRLSCTATTNIFLVESNLTLNVAARVSGGANLVKEGLGTMRLSSSNSFTGPVTVNDGRLTAAHPFALGTTAAGTFVNGNASLALDSGFDGIEIVDETLTLDSTNASALTSLGPLTNVWSGGISLQRTAGISVTDARGALTHSGFGTFAVGISGPGGFTKSGPGALFIGGIIGGNTYTGPTTVSEGLLGATRRPGRSLSDNIVVTGPTSTLRTGRASPNQFLSANTVLPAGANMTVQNSGLWAMTGTNFETLSRLVGNGNVDLGSASVLTLSNDASCAFSGLLSGTGALNKRGPATFQVTANSYSYTGLATVVEGTYSVNGDILYAPVTVKPGAILRGSGTLGDVTVEPGGVVKVDPRAQGVSGGVLGMNSVNFQPSGGVLGLDFFGPDPTGGNDFLGVNGSVALGNLNLSAGFGYPPREGDVVTLITKGTAGAVSGIISGFPEGSVQNIGNIPVVVSYVGGNGNDVSLTVTNLPLRGDGSQLVSGRNGSVLVPNDCIQLWLAVTNRGATTVSNLRGTLRSLKDGVVVTIAEAAFPNLAPNARGTDLTPFQIRTEPTFPCGAGAKFELVLIASNAPPIAILYTLLGSSGYALDFDGRDDQVEIPANTFSSVVNNFTIELWANPAGNRTQTAETNSGVSGVNAQLRQLQRFAVFPDRGNLAYGVSHVSAGLSIGLNGISAYEQGTNSLQGTLYLPSRLVYSNAVSGWTHVALVYASRAPRLYVNGTLVRSGSASLFSSVHASGSLGGSPQAKYGNFEGQLDEVRIWNVALSQTQIASNMNRTLTGAEANLVTYFRCDEGGGSVLGDSASASPNPTGTVTNGAEFVFPGVVPFTPAGGVSCDSGGGACESCFAVGGTFATNTPTLAAPLDASSSPSLCSPARPCPGPFVFPLVVPFIKHTFANTSGTQACVTAQLHFDCPASPLSGLHAAAYLGVVDTNNPCLNYLGDSGGDGTAAFFFQVPAGSNVVILVTQRALGFGCDNYTLELFGLPCPPPRLAIAREAAPQKVRVHWSTAYPGWTAQSAGNVAGIYTNVPLVQVIANGRYALTNLPATNNDFFRLREP